MEIFIEAHMLFLYYIYYAYTILILPIVYLIKVYKYKYKLTYFIFEDLKTVYDPYLNTRKETVKTDLQKKNKHFYAQT